jgi:hypothetical protein
MTITYTVNPETFLVEIFSPLQEEPFIYQPDWPNGDAWLSIEEATEWAEEFVAFYNKETNIPPRSWKDHSPEPVSPEEGTDPVVVAEEE